MIRTPLMNPGGSGGAPIVDPPQSEEVVCSNGVPEKLRDVAEGSGRDRVTLAALTSVPRPV